MKVEGGSFVKVEGGSFVKVEGGSLVEVEERVPCEGGWEISLWNSWEKIIHPKR